MEVRNKLKVMIINENTSFYDRSENIFYLPIQRIDELIGVINNYTFPHLKILSTQLITKEVIEAIKDNQHISAIQLGCSDDPYTLTREVFDILNSSESLYFIDTAQVIGNYGSSEMDYLAFFNQIKVGRYKISDLMLDHDFTFYQVLSDEEIGYLKKYLSNNGHIHFKYTNYLNIIDAINQLSGKQLHFHIVLSQDLSQYFTQFQTLLDLGEHIDIMDSLSLNKYMLVDSVLDWMVVDIKKAAMSPYEKYLAVYEIVTHYKLYLENTVNTKREDDLEAILFSSFMACYGFVDLLVALLDKVGIKAVNVDVDLYKEKEVITPELYHNLSKEQIQEKLSNVLYHSRALVHLIDHKYRINGLFWADPTWDNVLDHHYFNHSLMTPYEASLELVQFYETKISIFNVSNWQEFMDKVNFFTGVLSYFLEIIEKIDVHYYQHLVVTYDCDITDLKFLTDVYNYIVTHTKYPISKENQDQALSVLFRFVYSDLDENQMQEFLNNIKEENALRNDQYFKRGMR